MAQNNDRDPKHDGRRDDPNAGRTTPGHQTRVMSEEETLDTASNDSMDASDPPSMTQPGLPDPAPLDRKHADSDADIWERKGNLSLAREVVRGEVDLPPLPEEYEQTGPLRLILRQFLDAPEIWRDRMTLRLENGQSYNATDISELLSRGDSPFNP